MATAQLPNNFRATICDFTNDLSTTFPEYKYLWDKWAKPETTEEEFQTLFTHCSKVYPERFFDILNQDASLFSAENNVTTTFLPDVEFKMLYHCVGISDKTRESIWKYLQVILFIVVGSMKDKMDFGDAVNLFENMNQEELHSKMEETMENIGSFFQNMEQPKQAENSTSTSDTNHDKKIFSDLKDQFAGINEHLRGMFDGKIGKLARELADDLGNDLIGTFGEDLGNARSTKDILSKLMQNPQQITGLMKSVGDKLNAKMDSGDISREELMSEAGDMMRKMKAMTGGNMGNLFKNLAKNMNMPMPNPADFAQMQRNMTPAKTAQQQQKEQQAMQMKREMEERQAAYDKFMTENPNIFNTDDPNSLVYRLEGEKQEKSSIHGPSSEKVSASKKKRMKQKAKKEQANMEAS